MILTLEGADRIGTRQFATTKEGPCQGSSHFSKVGVVLSLEQAEELCRWLNAVLNVEVKPLVKAR